MIDEVQLRDLFENAVDVIYAHDLGGNFTAINKAGERLTGYRRDEITAMRIQDVVEPESAEMVAEMVRRELGGGERSISEITLITKEGKRIAIEVGTRLVFRSGMPVGVQGIARDITERKRLESLERDRNHVLELTAANVPLEQTLGGVCALIERQCGETKCAIAVWREGSFGLGAAPNLPPNYEKSWRGPDASVVSAAYGRKLAEDEPTRVELASEPELRNQQESLRELNLPVCWAFPILSSNTKRLGAILLYVQDGEPPGQQRCLILQDALRLATIAIEHKKLTDQLAYQGRHDVLTDLPNRLFFSEKLEQALAETCAHSWHLAVLFLDLDRFKEINDTLGHPVGDMVLSKVARRLQNALRKADSLARLGGDEFAVVLPQVHDPHDALKVGRKLLEALAEPFVIEQHEHYLTGSIGVSLCPRDGADAATLERKADAAMYSAKSRGRNRVEFFTAELGSAVTERREIENALRRALDNGELQLYYQPQIGARGGLAGMEALLVWKHPKLGTTPPQKFIPVAEESGMIVRIGAWVLEQACRQSALWQRASAENWKVAVNVSATQFSRPGFVESVAQALADSGLMPSRLELELPESAVLRDLEESAGQMSRLRALGVSVSIDRFGMGSASFGYLRQIPVDAIKIDKSFLREIDRDANMVPLVRAILTLAHGLGLKVVAEGIETRVQLEKLRELGCDVFQGYFLGEPVPPAALERSFAEIGGVLG